MNGTSLLSTVNDFDTAPPAVQIVQRDKETTLEVSLGDMSVAWLIHHDATGLTAENLTDRLRCLLGNAVVVDKCTQELATA